MKPTSFGVMLLRYLIVFVQIFQKLKKNSKLATLIPCKSEAGCSAMTVDSSGMISASCGFMATA